MLETSMFESGRGRAQTRKPATVLVSTALHVAVILALMLVPLAHPQALPALSAAVGLSLPVVARADTPKPKTEARAPAVQAHIRPASSDLIQPEVIPSDIALVSDDPSDAFAEITSSPISTVGSVLRGIAERAATPVAPEPPPPPALSVIPVTAPIRVGGNVQAANLVHQVLPRYPALARQARVQGAVILEATIDREGTVSELRVISGHPLLIDAAREAVQQWKYKPTILNGEPIEVITTITVTFSLQQ